MYEFEDYKNYKKNETISSEIQSLKPFIIKAILVDHPDAIQELQKKGY